MPDVDERTIRTNGVDLHVVEAGTGTPVVLAHGFPELAYSWRHQIPALAAAGYRVIAPDQRGYGRSSRPTAIDDYDIDHLTDDLLGLLDDLAKSRPCSSATTGARWSCGSWRCSRPSASRGVVDMSVPFLPRRRCRRCR